MHYDTIQDPEVEFNERLRMEVGWTEVAKGLTQVLFGYATFFIGVGAGVAMVFIGLFGLMDGGHVHKGAKPSNANLWMLYLGLGILSVIGLISYGIIVGGKFKCMMGAAERHGARWFMFICIACLSFGPAFEIASGASNWQAYQELKHNPTAFKDLQLNPLGQWLRLIGFAISMLYPLFFLLFMRSVAVCLRSDAHVILVNFFVVVAAAMVAVTGYVLYQYQPGGKPFPPQIALILGGAWLIVLLLYVALIFVMRGLIITVMGGVKSPLET
jgi:hypothetical protein